MLEFIIGFIVGGLSTLGFALLTGGIAVQIVEVPAEENGEEK